MRLRRAHPGPRADCSNVSVASGASFGVRWLERILATVATPPREAEFSKGHAAAAASITSATSSGCETAARCEPPGITTTCRAPARLAMNAIAAGRPLAPCRCSPFRPQSRSSSAPSELATCEGYRRRHRRGQSGRRRRAGWRRSGPDRPSDSGLSVAPIKPYFSRRRRWRRKRFLRNPGVAGSSPAEAARSRSSVG
jgi:hypothetical protein